MGMQALPELGPCSASSGPLCGSSAWPLGLVKRIAFGLGHAHGIWALLYNSLKLLKLKGFEVGEPISQEGIGTTY